jgi:hypothetical protein
MPTDPVYMPVIEGYSGFPVAPREHQSIPGSVEWLLDAVERHVLAEQESLAQYEYLRTASGDPVITLLMQLILEDEERHHGLLKRIEATLRDALEWTNSPAALPSAAPPQQAVAAELEETAKALVKEERTGAHYLREFAHQQKDVNSGIPSLLIEMMAMDSEKHARLLQFVQDRLARRPHAEDGPAD